MKRYAIVIEQGAGNLSAYVPDLPGCITTGRTVEEIEHNIREDGEPVPEPHTARGLGDIATLYNEEWFRRGAIPWAARGRF
jgi:hypothetical protein